MYVENRRGFVGVPGARAGDASQSGILEATSGPVPDSVGQSVILVATSRAIGAKWTVRGLANQGF